MAFSVKTYIVQKADGQVIAVKLTFDKAHEIAKAHAPAQVIYAEADKTGELNVLDQKTGRPVCN